MTYEYAVRNTGDVPLANIADTIVDDTCAPVVYVSGDLDQDGLLDTPDSIFEDAADETWLFTCMVFVDADTVNTVVVTGTPVDAAGTLLCGAADARQDATPGITDTAIRIGVEADVGSLSLDGENSGFRLAFVEANARGGVHGRRIVWADRRRASGAPADVLAVARRMIDEDQVFALVNFSGPAIGASGRSNRNCSSVWCVASVGVASCGTNRSGALSSLSSYAYVGTCAAAVQRSTCSAGHAKFASVCSWLNATGGEA